MKRIFFIILIWILNFTSYNLAIFKALPSEIKKAWGEWFPPKAQRKTWKDVKDELQYKSKNELFNILKNIVAQESGVLPIAERALKHKSKSENSKRVFITAILNMLSRRESALHPSKNRESKERSGKRIFGKRGG